MTKSSGWIATRIRENVRAIPGQIPIGIWKMKCEEYEGDPIPWFHPLLEYMTPLQATIIRAKAKVWFEVTGHWPTNIDAWKEVRVARFNGDAPHRMDHFDSMIDEDGTLHCGDCGARWSNSTDGSSYPERCGLCDALMAVDFDVRQVAYA